MSFVNRICRRIPAFRLSTRVPTRAGPPASGVNARTGLALGVRFKLPIFLALFRSVFSTGAARRSFDPFVNCHPLRPT